ncbi:MAG: DUF6168 family protein [Flavobacteriaceae bacterium]|nr:DUF6168 family protein [Flavobacteriaceae bacterium]
MKKTSLRFLLSLLLLLVLLFGLHLFILHLTGIPLFENQIIRSYIVNYLLAVIVLVLVEKSLNSNSAQAGFVFMAGSAIKFLVFFLVFYPTYKADGKMQTVEFIAFFVPYSICLIAEVIYLSKQLNNQSS